MRILVTGVSGYVGAALAPTLARAGHEIRGLARDPARVHAEVNASARDIVRGDVLTGDGLMEALDGIDTAYYLVHSMETATGGNFKDAELRGADKFAEAARKSGVRRIVYLGGLVPSVAPLSPHIASRLAVEKTLLAAAPESIAFRASIVIGARSRSFRFLVRLVQRMPVLTLPSWRSNRTQPIDGRDLLEFLVGAVDAPVAASGRSWDLAGPTVVSYEELIREIADVLMIDKPIIGFSISMNSLTAPVAAAIGGEDVGLVAPLMESLSHDLLPRGSDAAPAFGVRLHTVRAATERALREWEQMDPGAFA